MPKRSPNTVQMFEGKVSLYKRARSPRWQVRFRLQGIWFRISSATTVLSEAKEFAEEQFLQARFRSKNNLAPITKRFRTVALAVRARLEEQLEAGGGHVVYRDYIRVIDNYLIPFLGNHNVDTITPKVMGEFERWRSVQVANWYNSKASKLTADLKKAGVAPAEQRQLSASTLNTHNAALKLVFTHAIEQGLALPHQIPELRNKGEKSQKRPSFEMYEYTKLYRHMRQWHKRGKTEKSRQMRALLRDYVLILANSGIRHGTEAANLRWRDLEFFEKDGVRYLKMWVCGKTGKGRWCVPRHGAIRYFRRIYSASQDLKHLRFIDVVGHSPLPVFRTADGSVCKNLHQTFEALLEEAGLLKDKRTGQNRTLYSLRHFYATQMLMRGHTNIHALARQMGTSTQMLEQFYSDFMSTLTPMVFAGNPMARQSQRSRPDVLEEPEP